MKILFIDGNNIAHMAYHSGMMLSNSGERVEVLFSGLRMIKGYLQKFEPDRVVVVWDGGRDERRKAVFPFYKKRKVPTELEKVELKILFKQMALFNEILIGLGLTNYKILGREGDDILYNLILQAETVFMNAAVPIDREYIIVSSDKDFYQLFPMFNVKIFNPIKKKLMTKEILEKELGFDPRIYVDYKAIIGDPSDNLPGITGIGPVGAKVILDFLFVSKNGFMSLKQPSKKQQKILTKFEENLETYELMIDLILFKLIPEAELRGGKDKLKLTSNEIQKNALKILNEYGFVSLLEGFNNFIFPFELLNRREKHED